MEYVVIGFLSIGGITLGFTTFNLLRKVEKIEDVVIRYDRFISEYSKQLDNTDKRLKEIDEKGTFKSDDEIGWFFKQIKRLQNDVSRFKTEDAIVLYNNTSDSEVRSKIYEREIHYAFFKLTENIIHTFKFYHTEVSNLEHLQHEIITFLLSKIHLFDPSRGAKAYSYFGTIVKRWLILYNTKNYNKKIKKVEVDVLTKDTSTYVYNNVDNYGNQKDD